jgi:hypothetical protein
MRTMLPLRLIGLVSNVLFAGYGYVGGLYPVLVLHSKRCSVALLACSAGSVGVGWRPLPGQEFVETVLRPAVHQAG